MNAQERNRQASLAASRVVALVNEISRSLDIPGAETKREIWMLFAMGKIVKRLVNLEQMVIQLLPPEMKIAYSASEQLHLVDKDELKKALEEPIGTMKIGYDIANDPLTELKLSDPEETPLDKQGHVRNIVPDVSVSNNPSPQGNSD